MIFDPLEEDDPLETPFGGDDGDDDLEENLKEVSKPTLLAFVTVAVLVQAGILGVSLGVMLIGFEGQWTIGGGLAIGGGIALGLAFVSYRRYRKRR